MNSYFNFNRPLNKLPIAYWFKSQNTEEIGPLNETREAIEQLNKTINKKFNERNYNYKICNFKVTKGDFEKKKIKREEEIISQEKRIAGLQVSIEEFEELLLQKHKLNPEKLERSEGTKVIYFALKRKFENHEKIEF